MEHTIEKGIYRKGDVYRFYDVEEAKQHKDTENWIKSVEHFKKFLGKYYKDPNTFKTYKIIGLEDNQSFSDYYFIMEDKAGNRMYKLVNDVNFYKHFE